MISITDLNIELKKEYLSIGSRSFQTKLDIYLFTQLIKGTKFHELEIDVQRKFQEFKIDDNIRKVCEEAWKLDKDDHEATSGLIIKEIDTDIIEWKKINKGSLLMNQLRKQYIEDFENVLPVGNFIAVYKVNVEDRKCYYCGIAELQIRKLWKEGELYTKRYRGYKMEIDRENFHEYDDIVLSCYYCNNAKSDVFSREEFIPVGKEIWKVWSNRLSKINL